MSLLPPPVGRPLADAGLTLASRRPDPPSRRCQGASPETSAPRLPGGGGDGGGHAGSWARSVLPTYRQALGAGSPRGLLGQTRMPGPTRPGVTVLDVQLQRTFRASAAPRPRDHHWSPSPPGQRLPRREQQAQEWSLQPGPPSWAILPAAPPVTPPRAQGCLPVDSCFTYSPPNLLGGSEATHLLKSGMNLSPRNPPSRPSTLGPCHHPAPTLRC